MTERCIHPNHAHPAYLHLGRLLVSAPSVVHTSYSRNPRQHMQRVRTLRRRNNLPHLMPRPERPTIATLNTVNPIPIPHSRKTRPAHQAIPIIRPHRINSIPTRRAILIQRSLPHRMQQLINPNTPRTSHSRNLLQQRCILNVRQHILNHPGHSQDPQQPHRHTQRIQKPTSLTLNSGHHIHHSKRQRSTRLTPAPATRLTGWNTSLIQLLQQRRLIHRNTIHRTNIHNTQPLKRMPRHHPQLSTTHLSNIQHTNHPFNNSAFTRPLNQSDGRQTAASTPHKTRPSSQSLCAAVTRPRSVFSSR
nr:MAG TPA: hypothetical protein [Caudoviricetes sp.]